jgi:4-hydroxybenzoate polyprenyltransferase
MFPDEEDPQREIPVLECFVALGAVAAFCLISSAVYLVNDLRDIERDRAHPKKRLRPIAAGRVTIPQATAAATLLVIGAVATAWIVRPEFSLVVAAYAAMMVAYSAGLKHLVILDVCVIAAGFVLRAAGGAIAIDVPISPWLYVCTALLALLIGFGKRRNELSLLECNASAHRANLDAYTLPMLDQLTGVSASATVVAYALYTFDANATPGAQAMMLTVPFVAYAVFRYLYLIHHSELSGSPELLLFRDRPLLASIVGWGVTSLAILYALA